MLKVTNLFRDYGKTRAVNDVSFEVKPGEIFGFLGPNGAGKTSTIKVCTGLLKPTAGSVSINGYDIVQEPVAAKGQFGYVPDNPFLYNKLTGWEFLRFVGSVYLRDSEVIDERIKDALEMLELTDKADELLGSYSMGMRRKTAIAAAILHRPPVLFLDEPTSGLDAVSAKRVKDLLRTLANEGSAILLTTHIMEIAELISDRIGVINKGRLIATGTMDELRAQAPGATLEEVFMALTTEGSNQ
ncbi:MAG: ABC transporter ATP-binding protein [Firmicutes bacterium]|nr:ABC transporter ATP-binding protein [Bacillota bacterium]